MLEQTHAWFGAHRAQAMAIANSEFELRRLGFDEPGQIAQAQAQEVLDQWVRALELSLFCGAIQEAVALLGLTTVAQVIGEHERIDVLVRTLSRLDPDRILDENRALLEPLRRLQPPADGPAAVDMDLVVRAAESLLEHCPVAAQQRLAAIRAERRARNGVPVVRPDLVRREVIASQRIEDVDARPWLKT